VLTSSSTIGWKYYLVFIICGSLGGLTMWFVFPDTNGLPLEEIAALFGDEDEIAVYQREIDITDGGIINDHHVKLKDGVTQIENEKEV
jgi:hypothetical protein